MNGEGKEVTVEGEVKRVTFESPSSTFRVIKVEIEGQKEPIAVVGHFPPVAAGARVRIRGALVVDKTHGEQLRAENVTILAPTTLKGLERHLGSGTIPGVGPKTAARIVEHFGLDALRVLDDSPDRLVEVHGLSRRKAEQIAEAWRDQREVREVLVMLSAHGISPALADRIYRRYGRDAVNVVSQQPYRLALDVRGIGFQTADKIAQAAGIARDAPERLQAGILQALGDRTEQGHVYTLREELLTVASALLRIDEEKLLLHALEALRLGGYVIQEDVLEGAACFLRSMHTAEVRLADRLLSLARIHAAPLPGEEEAIAGFQASTGVALAKEQRDALALAARAPVLVITGGPGVGKTTVLRALLALFEHAKVPVQLAAPTGRAAKRMNETTGREARTLHRLLEFDPKRNAFKRNAASPIMTGAIIVDEASMIDLPLADSLTQAIAPGTRLILVGDVDQLPSVGPGAVLRDVLTSPAIPSVRLTLVFRQAEQSLIVQNAHRIHRGEKPTSPGGDDADFFVIERKDAESAKSTVIELVKSRIPKRFGFDPVRDVQVLVPMHRGDAGAIALNDALQEALNPHGPTLERGNRRFRLRDKVMQLRNDYDKDVWNGDLGIIEHVEAEDGKLTVRFDDRAVTYENAELDDLTLAYACTVHKSQGSEYPAVVVVMLTAHFVMLSRNLLYTAVTRGKRLVVLVSDSRAIEVALREERRNDRRSRLAERLQGQKGTGGDPLTYVQRVVKGNEGIG
ncbi:MAG TPA: ATP-dependent RecD-like DNA helicase [Polyangiaceae bacterium]